MEASAEGDQIMSSAEAEKDEAQESDEEYVSGEEDDDEDEEEDDDDDEEEDDDDDEEGDDVEEHAGNDEEWDTEEDEAEEDGEDDGQEEEEDQEDEMLEVSESDDDSTESCPICLNRFREQDVGTPEACDHAFCLECIVEWSKNVNTCPVDRQVFRLIMCRHGGENNIYKRMIVQDRNEQAKEEDEEDPTYCEVCEQCDREDRLLLCDGCDKGYHLECLTPALDEVPVNEWFCPQCAQREVEEEEEDVPQTRPVRRVARTRIMERVRSAIEELRVRRTRSLRRILSSDEEEEEEEESSATPSASSSISPVKKATPRKPRRKTPRKYKRRKTTAKTKKKRKRKTTKTKTTKKRKTTTKRKRKVKGKRRKVRRGKKGRARTVRQTATVTTAKSRIAGALGIETPPAGRTIPTQKNTLDKTLEPGSHPLSIFGSKEQLIHFDDDYNTDSAAARAPKYSRSSLSSYKPIGRVPIIIPTEKKKKKIVINTAPVSVASGPLDILGSIMQDQSKLHMDSKHVKIQRDGSLISKDKKRKKASEEDESSSKFFKSSFTAIQSGSGPSILNSLSATTKPSDMTEEYDPAHPTEEMEEDLGAKVEEKADDIYDPAHPTDELEEVSEEEESQDQADNTGSQSTEKPDRLDKKGGSARRKNDKDKKKNLKKDVETDQGHLKSSVNAGQTDKKKSVSESSDKLDNVNSDSNPDVDHFEIDENIPLCKEFISPTKDNKETKQDPSPKVSPSIKITETGKKVSPSAIKPFEISKKTLYEKKRLYGGEIDFTEDVTFTDAGFENFEVNVKAIESVFKGTVSKQNEKSNDEVETVTTDEKEKKDENKENDDTLKLTAKFSSSKAKSEKNSKGPKTMNERFRMLSEEGKENDIVSLEEEDPIHEMRKLDKELDLELENPDVGKGKDWHRNKGESEKEHKKSRRKVSIDRDEDGRIRHRKEGRDRKHDWEEVEEGEVEDEQQYRERKRREKREKKKKAAEKERYYNDIDMQYSEIDNPESELDTRIVVQVSQNTDSRTVWEEDEKIRKRKDKEERDRRKERHRDEERSSKKKRKRHRSRSHSYDRRDKSKSRERKRSRSRTREKSKRRHKDRSRSRSFERSRKKKKKDRDRSREKRRSREKSEERVDIFGRSRSPFRRKDTAKDRDSLSPIYETKYSAMKKKINDFQVSKSKKPRIDGDVILIDIDDDDEDDENNVNESETLNKKSGHSVSQPNEDSNSPPPSPSLNHDVKNSSKMDAISKIEVKDISQRDISSDEKDDDYDDEPEETEQFNYTDRDEYLSQNKHKQQHQNLIQIGMDGGTYDPANPTECSSPILPPLPDHRSVHTPTPPLPPVGGEFAPPLFPPPPPGPPPPGPPPPTVLIQDRPPVPAQLNGPPGQGIMGENPQILIRGPPPMEPPPQGMIHPRPNISLPMNINVAPPGFHRGLPQTVQPQRQIIVNAFKPGPPRMQRLPNPNVPRFGFTSSAEVVTPQFGLPSHPRPNIINGPYDGLPPPTDGPPPNLPPPHSHFALGPELHPPPRHMLPMHDGPPPSNLVQIPVEVEEGQVGVPLRPLGPPVSEAQLIHMGQIPGDHPPRLPIPLLPTSEPPRQALVSIPPPEMSLPPPIMSGPTSLVSIPSVPHVSMHPHIPPHPMPEDNRFIENRTPPQNQVESIFEMSKMNAHVNNDSTVIPGLDMVEPSKKDSKGPGESGKTYSQLEEISKLLSTQAKLMLGNNKTEKGAQLEAKRNGTTTKDDGVFKVPLPPGMKSLSGSKSEVETNEVVDMDMASPILEEGNIELPVSPQFDNLIDTDDWLEEVYNNKMQKNNSEKSESKSSEKWEEVQQNDNGNSKTQQKTSENSDKTDKWMDIINNASKKSLDVISGEKLEKVDKTEIKDVKSNKEKVSTPSKVKDQEAVKKDSPKKSVEKKQASKENKHKSHRKHKHKSSAAKEMNLKQKAQVDTELDLDSQELTSAVDMTNKEKYLRKLHLQERVVEEVKMAIKPHYANKKIDKDQYKEIMRKAVPKICHSKSGDINPMKIKSLIEAYVDRFNKNKDDPDTPDRKQPSPNLKANGERAKTKTAR